MALRVRSVDFGDARDASAYVELLGAYARDPMGGGQALPEQVLRRLPRDLAAHPGAHGLLAESDGRAVGFATCFVGYSTFLAQPLLNVHDIAVLPAWRRRSVARQLLEAIAELGRRLDCCRITLEVREDNAVARGLYRDVGFRPAPCSLFMEKPL